MNITAEQKKYLVPASIGTAVFVICDELIFKGKGKGKGGKAVDKKSLLAAAASSVAGYFYYDKADAATKADLDKYALPTGAGAAAFIAVNRLAMPKIKPGKDGRPYALGAAAVAAFFLNKETNPSTTVGMYPVFPQTFDPPFPPAFGPEFEG